MAYEDLLNRGLIKPFAAGSAQSASRLALAKRDIKAAGAMLAILLVPPYMQYHDLAIGFIAIALALMAAESIPDITRNSLFLFVLAVCAVTFANLKTDRLFPIMPIALIVCFAFCLRKAFSDTGNKAIFLGASHSE